MGRLLGDYWCCMASVKRNSFLNCCLIKLLCYWLYMPGPDDVNTLTIWSPLSRIDRDHHYYKLTVVTITTHRPWSPLPPNDDGHHYHKLIMVTITTHDHDHLYHTLTMITIIVP